MNYAELFLIAFSIGMVCGGILEKVLQSFRK